MPMSRLLAGTRETSFAVDQHRARGRLVEAGEQPQRGGLAAARRSEQGEQLAGLDPQVQPVECGHGAEHPAHVAVLDGGAGRFGADRPARRALDAVSSPFSAPRRQFSAPISSSSSFDEQQAEHRRRRPAPDRTCVGSWESQTGNGLVYSRIEEIVYSPITSAKHRNAALRIAVRRHGQQHPQQHRAASRRRGCGRPRPASCTSIDADAGVERAVDERHRQDHVEQRQHQRRDRRSRMYVQGREQRRRPAGLVPPR